MVSAWSSRHQLVLGQVAVEQKSNEIKAIPVLLEQLDLKGAIVTIDAMGTQKTIVQQIQNSGADYILTLKANHPTLAQDADDWFEKHKDKVENKQANTIKSVCEAGHHRIEKRYLVSVPVEQVFDPKRIKQWEGLQTLIVEQSSRQLWNKTTYSTRFFLSSLEPGFANFPDSIRSHWGVENQLYKHVLTSHHFPNPCLNYFMFNKVKLLMTNDKTFNILNRRCSSYSLGKITHSAF
ncbi:MAG: ISAs1 family transposase [Cyanobacteria bacterium P01_G01_bin.39]